MATTWNDFQPILDEEDEAAEPDLCEADRYNQANEAYDGVCLAPLRPDGTCPRAFTHVGYVAPPPPEPTLYCKTCGGPRFHGDHCIADHTHDVG